MARRRSIADGPSWIVKRGHQVWHNCKACVVADGQVTFTTATDQVVIVPEEGTVVTERAPHGVNEHVTWTTGGPKNTPVRRPT